jgi:glycosyltransferase involved in cell wall biosynthesis
VPAVSVVTPAWNAAAFLGDTIDSVRAQTFTDWELLVVDDGSTDETAALVERAAAADPRIRLLRQANSGPSAARNHAMREARGSFFAFLDSDDRWSADYLEQQLAVFTAHPDTALVTGTGFYDGGPFHGKPTRSLQGGPRVLPLAELLANESAVFIMTVFRREVFDRIGGFDERQWTSEDYDFWLRAALAGFVFRQNPRPLGLYRVRGGSLSRNRIRMLRGLLETFSKTRPHCADGSRERRVLDAQVTRFESELLLEEAKAAIESHDYPAAASCLRGLRARGAGRNVAITAWLAEHAPFAAAIAYRLRGWRPSRLRATLPPYAQHRAGTGP